MSITIHGWAFSPYVRAVRMTAREKGIGYTLNDIHPAALGQPPLQALSPFGKVPVVQHGDFTLLETPAILRYLDEAFPGPSLQPELPRERAMMEMLSRIASLEFYPTGVMGVFFKDVYVRANGGEPNQDEVRAAAIASTRFLDVAEARMQRPFLAGDRLSLADMIVAPMISNFLLSETGKATLAAYPRLSDWYQRVAARPSFQATVEPVPLFGL